ncbi:MAG: TonB-dependent receptor, partial [Mediterranea sp.]|nr:TonB-dependent receptor [Mediterranea sp.]
MRKYILFIALLSNTVLSAFAQRYTVTGKVISSKEKNPIEFASVFVIDNGIWTVTNEKGEFTLTNLSEGKYSVQINSLGYVERTYAVEIPNKQSLLSFVLQEDNLALDEVVITAKRKTNDMATSYAIDRTTLDHTQILNISDIASLLPGGKSNGILNLAEADERLAIHAGSSEFGNPSFGTAIEVDGIRAQNNASFEETKGVSTRNISTTNIESIEVVTGIPSVEHGDFTNGIVKVNTQKGTTPITVNLSTKPHTKQAAISKGFLLGSKSGTLNTSLEYTKSNSDLASPHKTYDRNSFSLTYDNTFNKKRGMPLRLTVGLSGNAGGYDSKADPDAFKDTYTQKRDNAIQGYVKLNWLLNKLWVTNMEASGSVSYADKLSKINTNKSVSSTTAFIHATEEGYFMGAPYDENNPDTPIILSPVGYWYELAYRDSKPINYTAKFKADWIRQFGPVTNKLMVGGQYDRSGNEGKGLYYDSMKYAPTWREDRHDSKPYMNNMAWYVEDKITLPVAGQSKLQVMAGIRSDITYINGSEYGTVRSFSPRFNAQYTFWEKASKWVKSLSIHAGWGKAVKLPSFEV